MSCRPRGRVQRGATTLTASLLVLVGCGVPMQDSARPIPELSRPTTATASPTAPDVGVRLWFVGDTALQPVVESRPSTPSSTELLTLLAAGPPADTSASAASAQLRTLLADPLTGGALVTTPDTAARPTGTVTVTVADAFSALPAAEQVRLLGQVVLTLTDAGASGVSVTDTSGNTLAIPLPDGALLARPAVRGDYAPLAAPSSSPSSG